MANTIFSSEGALLFIMVATVALGFWLQRFKVFKTLGPALTVIVMGIVMSNLRIVPTSSPTYDAISSYCVPLSVSICLLSLDLKQMRKLSKEPIIALASAIFSVCVAALVFGILFANNIDEGWKVAGMFVGTYTGGSSNLTAIAVGLDASKNTIAFRAPLVVSTTADRPRMAEITYSTPTVCFCDSPMSIKRWWTWLRSGIMGLCPFDTRRITAKHTSKIGRPSIRNGTTKEMKLYILNIPCTDTVAII